ncbi:MAG: ChbG/HpnK family deacetylase [Elusimicrobia bacterium]|nr:ChbG/HpnK family deacetylase [Candidatus Liberimonas magnetica]
MKHIIINADDFGLNTYVNEGIIECCRKQAITSVSTLVVGEEFDRGMSLIKDYGAISNGVHLCLTEEKPVCPMEEIPTLIDSKGNFNVYTTLVAKLIFGKIDLKEVYVEWKSQIDKFIEKGSQPAHLDTHQNLHIFPQFYYILVHLCEEYDIRAIRYLKCSLPAIYRGSFKNYVKYFLSLMYSDKFNELKNRAIMAPNAVYGFCRGDILSREDINSYVQIASPGSVSEIICHPGYKESSLIKKYVHWNYYWEKEMSELIDFVKKDFPKYNNLNLINYLGFQSMTDDYKVSAVLKPESLSVVIPAYNEYENIQKTINTIKRFLAMYIQDYEILVIDDNSSDGTGQVSEKLIGGKGKVIRNSCRKGYGASLKLGFSLANKEWIFYTDADYPANINNLLELFEYLKEYDLIIGKRISCKDEGLIRYIYSLVFNRLVKYLFDLADITDVNFAFKLIKKDVFKNIQIENENSFIDAELLIKAKNQGFRIKEVPVEYLKRTFGKSHMNNFKNILEVLKSLLRYYFSEKNV